MLERATYNHPMKWYFAGRIRHTQNFIKVAECIETQGQILAGTWLYGKSLKPYHEHAQEAQQVGDENIRAILESDVFVMVSDPEGTDMFVELGVALTRETIYPNTTRIYVIGEHGKRSLMHMHRAIRHVETMKDVLEQEGIETGDVVIPEFK